ncbi:uncharacterized protein LOC100145148 isoform X5 [Xenopus tropicalis]|uniref:Uncharacterized protein LOC100145148 isoform X5 n=1 Tax=Xenopus tropicalis TaxID=8364 RepID=A0A8J0SQ52_XENTR|nr:uncharacterized protein LOC100145148 isoform X5 [Xenopus tropicalis]|eukprot:XP_012819735.1 PREDICTED: uncharacterized protein LOC100145148 isoform X6 [Xenopus tropicalis]
MMEVFSSDKSSLDKYINLEDYVLCRKRKEPLIGLQYIVQMNSDVRSETAFQCNLCLKKGPLYCIMQHLKSFKHRLNYIRQKYDHILPLYGKNTPFYEQELILREQAKEIEQSEGSNKMKISINLTATGVYKDDFWKYNLIRHQKMSALKEKILHLADQQEAVLKYLTETSDSYKKNKKHEYKDKEYPENKGHKRRKRKSPWKENQTYFAAIASCSDEVLKPDSDGNSATAEECKESSKALRSSMDILSSFTLFSDAASEFKSETRKAIQDKQYLAHCSSVSVSEEFKESSFDTREAPEADDENKNSVKTSEQIQSRPAWVCRTKSTGKCYRNTKWESLFANDASSQKPLTPFKWGSKLTSSFDSTNINPADEQSKRRASTELLSSFTLFNRGNSTDQTHNSDPSWTRLSSPPSEDNSSNSHKGKDNCKEKDLEDNEDYCAADSSCSVTCDMDAYVTPVKDQIYVSVTHSNLSNPLGDIDMTKKPNQITAGQSADFQLERDEKTETEQDLCKKSCAQYLDIEDATTSTPQANIAHTESTPLTPELLQLLKGKDVNLITETLKTISPFYPALQKVNLEELAKVISETGALE